MPGSAALIVTGMHRSGTSFVASLLDAAGCSMGETLLAADRHNGKGYFEDVQFLDLNRRMLQASLPADAVGHADWGWTETATPDPRTFEAFDAEAAALIADRRAGAALRGTPWGWKDPRTTLLLDFWHRRLPDAKFVLVYRFPWEVADSMQRLGADVFLRRPDYAWHIWATYNRALLAFAERHREQTLLVSADALLRVPQRLPELVRSKLGLAIGTLDASPLADPAMFGTIGPRDPLASLTMAAHPACAGLLRDLERLADLPSGEPAPAPLAAPSPQSERPSVSIVIPCHDHGEFLLEAIASVERHVTVAYELIVVNDGSREEATVATLEQLRLAGYRVIDQEQSGLATARNRGIAEARAPIFLPLDADNRLRAGFVESGLQRLARDRAVVAVYGDRVEFGGRSGRVLVGVPDLNRLLCGNYIDACALIRVDAWRACGGYDANMPAQGAEDWDLWLSMLGRDFVLARLDIAAFDYRVRPDSMLARFADLDIQLATERYVLAKHAPLYLAHLRRQVDRLDASDAALADARAQLAALQAQATASRSR